MCHHIVLKNTFLVMVMVRLTLGVHLVNVHII